MLKGLNVGLQKISKTKCHIVKRDFKTDILIAGGGVVGCSTAYWIKSLNKNLDVTVIEKDYSYQSCSSVLSVGGVRQQFSEKENILMSMFCGHVLKNLNKYFDTNEDEKLDVQFIERGYLLLSNEEKSGQLKENFEIQKEVGASVELLGKNEIKHRWGWLNTEDIDCGVFGTSNEGWFDPWLLLSVIRKKADQLGVHFKKGSLIQFHDARDYNLTGAVYEHAGSNNEIDCKMVVNAAGAWASEVARLGELACGLSGQDYPLYVKPSKRTVYSFSCPSLSSHITPMVIDYNGVYFRKESSGDFIAGLSPIEEQINEDLGDIDYDWFDTEIWPLLYNRVPEMGALKIKGGWAGYYDYNTRDQNLIIGHHPIIRNMLLANGSSGHGIQHALAIGRANAELVVQGRFVTIDLSRLSYKRFLEPADSGLIIEKNII